MIKLEDINPANIITSEKHIYEIYVGYHILRNKKVYIEEYNQICDTYTATERFEKIQELVVKINR